VASIPGGAITNVEEVTDPTVNDDFDQGFDVGSRWTNTAAKSVWFCVDTTVGAAIWKDVSTPGAGSHPVHVDTVPPTINDDAGAGYGVGDHWIDSVTKRIYQAVSVAVGAAVWKRVDQPKLTIASVDPTASNNASEGYEVLSRWTNSVTVESFTLVAFSGSLALWRQDSNVPGAGKQTPKEHFLDGNLLDYGQVGGHPLGASEIQYSRVWLTAGLDIDRIRIFIDSGGAANRYVRAGLYDQTDVLDSTLDPNDKLEESAQTATDGIVGYADLPLGSTVSITVTGYYWIAFVASSTSIKFTVTGTIYRQDLIPRRDETTTDVVLPATASGLTNPQADLAYASAVEP
jgi:hypothetical protein